MIFDDVSAQLSEAIRNRVLIALGLTYGAWGVRRALRNRPHGHLHRHADGKFQMEFSASHGQACLIGASTNLVDWERIGVAVERESGKFEFEDPDAARAPVRFYRVVVPCARQPSGQQRHR